MIKASIVGGSGFTGGELLRLLLFHPQLKISQVTSKRMAGRPVYRSHPNLRNLTDLTFSPLEELEPCHVLFLCLPHGDALKNWEHLFPLAQRIIDLSADFRLKDDEEFQRVYSFASRRPEGWNGFIYGIPELHRDEIRKAHHVACAGCNATATLLALYPLFHEDLVHPDRTVVEVKVGSSEGGRHFSEASHHPLRSGCLRSFRPTGHRHEAEVIQELSLHGRIRLFLSATAVDAVRGILATCHVFPKEKFSEKEVWKLYRSFYGNEPFIRIVKERRGIYRYPEPKILSGTNYCDIGFETDAQGERLVIISALDNLMKGSAGQAVQNMNLMFNFPEKTGLEFPGLHPV